MPGMFRIMKKDADDKPTIADGGDLGIRPGRSISMLSGM